MKNKKIIKIIIALVIIAAIGLAVYFFLNKAKNNNMNGDMDGDMFGSNLMTETAFIGTIENKISASSPVKPADSYKVSSLVEGKVIVCDVAEGDTVKKDQVLYQVEDKKSDKGIMNAQKALDQANKSYNKLTEEYSKLSVRPEQAGNIIEMSVKKGDMISAGQVVCKLENRKVMKLEVPFLREDAQSFKKGQEVKVIMESSFEELFGTVTHISKLDEVIDGNFISRIVTVEVKNPGGIIKGARAVAYIGEIACTKAGEFDYKSSTDVYSEGSGKVLSVNYQKGDFITESDVIVRLSAEELDERLEQAQETIDSAKEDLKLANSVKDNYIIKSPIDGTIIEKSGKLGDNISSGNELMTIYDMSYLTFTMNIMENDIKKIQVGQVVSIYGSEDEYYEGEVTRVGINGSTDSYTTTYPVTVVIREAQGLLPGMNVRADIITDIAENVLMVPVSAVVRGGLVLVSQDSPSASNALEGEMPPEGYVYVPVEIGVSDKDYVEIKSGLVEGDVVGYTYIENNINDGMMDGEMKYEGDF